MKHLLCGALLLAACASGGVRDDAPSTSTLDWTPRPWEPASVEVARGLLPHLSRCGLHAGDRISIFARVDRDGALSGVEVRAPADHAATASCIEAAVLAGAMELEPEFDHYVTWVGGRRPERWRTPSPPSDRVRGLDASPSNVHEVVQGRLSSVHDCYRRELRRAPGIGGTVVVEFAIGKDGRVARTALAQVSEGLEAVARCAEQTVARWSFPVKPKEEVEVSYPFVFTPSG